MSSNDEYRATVISAKTALAAAEIMLRAESGLLDTRLQALRHSADFSDRDVISGIEGLASRVSSWRAEAVVSLSAAWESVDVLKSVLVSFKEATPRADNAESPSEVEIAAIEADIDAARLDAESGRALAVVSSFEKDPVFNYLTRKSERIALSSTRRMWAGDRWLSSLSRFNSARANYEEAKAVPGQIASWIAMAELQRDTLRRAEIGARIERLHLEEQATDASKALAAGAEVAIRRAWAALMELADVEDSEFTRLDFELACAIARETASAAIRAARSGETVEPLAFEAEQEKFLGDIADAGLQAKAALSA